MGSIFSSKDYTATVYLPIEIRRIILECIYGDISIEKLSSRISNIDDISKEFLSWVYKHSSSYHNNLIYTLPKPDGDLYLIDSTIIFEDQNLIDYIITSEVKTAKYHQYKLIYLSTKMICPNDLARNQQYIQQLLYTRAINEDYIDLCHRLIDEYVDLCHHSIDEYANSCLYPVLNILKRFRNITESYIINMNKKGLHIQPDKYIELIDKIEQKKTDVVNRIHETAETFDLFMTSILDNKSSID